MRRVESLLVALIFCKHGVYWMLIFEIIRNIIDRLFVGMIQCRTSFVRILGDALLWKYNIFHSVQCFVSCVICRFEKGFCAGYITLKQP